MPEACSEKVCIRLPRFRVFKIRSFLHRYDRNGANVRANEIMTGTTQIPYIMVFSSLNFRGDFISINAVRFGAGPAEFKGEKMRGLLFQEIR